MFILRPAREGDLPGIVALAQGIGGGLTTLPADKTFLRDRIHDSLRAFSPLVRKPGGEFYLFVLEEEASGGIVGTSGIAARVGGYEPFYSYEIRTERHAHAPLAVEKGIEVLHLKKTHRGPTEICSLFLHPERRGGGLGRLLSLGRFLFMATFPQRFDATVIAELRGYSDREGRSPFWESVGRNFFERDFNSADFLSGLGNKEFIEDLMPAHPIYVPLLPRKVRAIIGRVHLESEPALALLLAEGFQKTNEVDIFDAGPQVRAALDRIRTVRRSRTAVVKKIVRRLPDPRCHILANQDLDFRAVLGAASKGRTGLQICEASARALGAKEGGTIQLALLRR